MAWRQAAPRNAAPHHSVGRHMQRWRPTLHHQHATTDTNSLTKQRPAKKEKPCQAILNVASFKIPLIASNSIFPFFFSFQLNRVVVG